MNNVYIRRVDFVNIVRKALLLTYDINSVFSQRILNWANLAEIAAFGRNTIDNACCPIIAIGRDPNNFPAFISAYDSLSATCAGSPSGIFKIIDDPV